MKEFFIGCWESDEDCFNLLKLKTTFCKYGTPIKIKIGMICVYKEYEVKKVQEQRLQLKMKFLLGYNIKVVI